ncbi:MAG: DUF971 domain-containing protein [Maioricimonas sp. JB049]
MTPTPSNIRALSEDQVLEVTWPDGRVQKISFVYLRGECPCAECVHEVTGEKLIDVDSIPRDVHPTKLGLSGNYALRIVWSDGHFAGLYTWDRLNGLQQAGPDAAR